MMEGTFPDGQKIPKITRNGSNRASIFKMVRNASKWARIPKMGRQGPRWTGVVSRKINRNGFFQKARNLGIPRNRFQWNWTSTMGRNGS